MVNDGMSTDFRQCPVCNTRFKGRKDKRYCCEDCRSAYNRSQRAASDAVLTEALSVLRINRGILKKLWAGKTTLVSREGLEALGFDASVYSSVHVNSRNFTYYFVADFGFRPMNTQGTDMALIIRREPFAKALDPWKAEIKISNP